MTVTNTGSPSNKKIYQKHHSFESFHTKLGSDIEQTRQRLIRVLKTEQNTWVSSRRDVLAAALADLEQNNPQAGGFKVSIHIADELSKIDDQNITRYVFHRYRYDLFPKQRKLDQYPPYLQIEPTSICNFRCVFCYQSDASFSHKSSGHMGSMTVDLFKEIIDQIEGNVEFISLASRGEPMACRDIDKMLEYSVGKFLGLKMNTNASLLNEAHCHAILAGGINTVVFSADAAEEPLYSQLRVGGKLEKVLSNIRLFQEIRKKHYPQSKIISRVSGVKVRDDQQMDSMLKTWGELVDQLTFVAYNPWENVYDSPVLDMKTPCSDLWRRMFIWYDGRFNPCDTDYKSVLSVGNIKENNVSQIWRSQLYNQLRDKHLNNQRSHQEPCRRCTVI
jgi:radical SAM protein with 4Fe4S-binding SPASM domain